MNNDGNLDNATVQTNCATGTGSCTLPAAVSYANTLGTNPTIAFALGTGIERINASDISITNSMTIDATTQSGYSGTPLIELEGSQNDDVDGFIVNGADNVTIRGFAIGNFYNPLETVPFEAGIHIGNAATNVFIEDNWLGLDANGNVFSNGHGLYVRGFSSNGTLPTNITIDGNVMSGNRTAGARIQGGTVTITNNIIGLDPAGQTAIGNNVGTNVTTGGLFIANESDGVNVGLNIANKNIIAGNHSSDLRIEAGTPNVVIRGNFIGTNITGDIRLSSSATNALRVEGSQWSPTTGVIIGGAGADEYNVITGVLIVGGLDDFDNITTNNITVINNRIGVNSSLTAPFASWLDMDANDSVIQDNIFGGSGNGFRAGRGAIVDGDNLSITGNYFGVTPSGLNMGAEYGLFLRGTNVTIGGSNPSDANYFSGNEVGVYISDTTGPGDGFFPDNITFEGNMIGIDPTNGDATIPNQTGIQVTSGANNVQIGVSGGQANIIAGNEMAGILIGAGVNGSTPDDNMPDNTTIVNNFIGRNASGTPLGNGGDGIHLKDGQNVTIGDGTTAGLNHIANNGGDGIGLEFTTNLVSNDGNQFTGNLIYDNAGLAIDLNEDGVTLNDVDDLDDGPNDLQNFPNLLGLVVNNGANTTSIEFELEGVANTNYRVDFYYNSNVCDASGYGEASNWITNSPTPVQFMTDSTGYYTDTVVITGLALNPTDLVTMLATDLDRDNSSEFSKCPLSPPVNFTATPVSQIQIDLAWTGNHPEADQMTIERSPDGVSGWVEIVSFALPQLAHSDTGLDCGTIYYYRAKNTDTTTATTSAYTDVHSATTSACPPNDDFANAIVIGAMPYTDAQQTFGATDEVSDPIPSCGTSPGRSIWYSFTPASTGNYIISTIGSDYDAVLSLWIDSGGLVEQACDFNSAIDGQALISMPLTGSTTYYIMLSGNNGIGGNATLNMERLADPTPTPMPTVPPPPTAVPPAVLNAVGLFNPDTNQWQFRDANATGNLDITFFWGAGQNNQALIGDWDGDNVDGISLYREGVFIFRNLSNGGAIDSVTNFGPAESGWQAIAGDWNADDSDSIGLYKDGQFMLSDDNRSTGYLFNFGPVESGWIPVAGDWNGDGFDTVGLYKDGTWILSSSIINPAIFGQINYGPLNDNTWKPVTGDWNADNTATIGLYGPGLWRVRESDNFGGNELFINFGVAGNWMPLSSYRGGVGNLSLLATASAQVPVPSPVTPEPVHSATPIPPTATATLLPAEITLEPEVTQESP